MVSFWIHASSKMSASEQDPIQFDISKQAAEQA